MTFYTELAADALATLTELGQAVTRRSYTTGTYDPATGAASVTTADTTRKGVPAGKTLERGSLIQVGDIQLLVDATATIEPQDHFVVGGVEYVIVSVGEVNPAGTLVLYDLHLRRA